MRSILTITITCLVLLLGSGCSKEPTFDATNDTTMKASIEKMTATMSAEEKKAFQQTFTGLAFLGALANMNSKKSPAEIRKEIFSKFDGKTVSEIMTMAEELKKEMQKSMKK